MAEKITPLQFFWLFINSRLIVTVVFNPALAVAPRNQDYWIAILLSWVLTILTALIWLGLWQKHPDKSFIQVLETVTGTIVGKVVGLLFTLFLFQESAIALRQMTEFIIAAVLPRTPLMVIMIPMVVIVAMTLRQGIETIARVAELTVPAFLVVITLILLFAVRDMRLERLLPVLEQGFLPVAKGGVTTAGRWIDFAWAAMIVPHINRKEKLSRALLAAIAVVIFYFIVIGSGNQAVFGPEVAGRFQFPFNALTRYISIAEFFERLDPFVIMFWIAGTFTKLAILAYASLLALTHWCHLGQYRPLTLPSLILILAASIWSFGSLTELRNYGRSAAVLIEPLFIFALPLVVLLIDTIRGRLVPREVPRPGQGQGPAQAG